MPPEPHGDSSLLRWIATMWFAKVLPTLSALSDPLGSLLSALSDPLGVNVGREVFQLIGRVAKPR